MNMNRTKTKNGKQQKFDRAKWVVKLACSWTWVFRLWLHTSPSTKSNKVKPKYKHFLPEQESDYNIFLNTCDFVNTYSCFPSLFLFVLCPKLSSFPLETQKSAFFLSFSEASRFSSLTPTYTVSVGA
jgi:hypothetical protein